MKLTVRTLAFTSALGVGLLAANLANAQTSMSFELRGVGGTAIPGGILEVLGPGSNFQVEVWLRNNTTSNIQINNINVMLGFSATGVGGTTAVRNDTVLSGGMVGGNTPTATIIGSGLFHFGTPTNRGAGATTGNNPLGTNRPWGHYSTITGVIGGGGWALPGNAFVPLLRYDLTNSSLALGDTYGDDAGEAGLIVYDAANPNVSLGNSWITLQGATARTPVTGHRVLVHAVPEPATMLVLGAGLAALAARRRRK